MSKKRKLFILGILISIIFLYLSLRGFNLHLVTETIKRLNLWLLLAGSLLFIISHLVRSYRWKTMLRHYKNISYVHSVGSFFIGIFGNNIFPGRLGDLWRAVIIKEREDVPRSLALASLLVERILDGIAILLFAAVIVKIIEAPGWVDEAIFYLGIILAAGVILLFVFTEIYERHGKHKTTKLAEIFGNVAKGFEIMRNPLTLLALSLLTLVAWVFEGASFYVFLKAFNLSFHPSLPIAILFIINLVVSIPAAPGALGTFEYGIVLSLSLYGFEKSTALTVAIVIHALRYASGSLLGLTFASIWHIKPMEEEKKLEEETEKFLEGKDPNSTSH